MLQQKQLKTGDKVETYFTSKQISFYQDEMNRHAMNRHGMLSIENNKKLDAYLKENVNKCFKATNVTYRDVIVLNYHHVYTLVYSITYNCLYVMQFACCDNDGYIGFLGSHAMSNLGMLNSDNEFELPIFWLDECNFDDVIALYNDLLTDHIKTVKNYSRQYSLKHDYNLKLMQAVIKGDLKDNEVFHDDVTLTDDDACLF